MPAVMDVRKVQTTVRLPDALYREIKNLVDEGQVQFESVNDLVIFSLEQFVGALNRKKIDAEFEDMAHDAKYAKVAKVLAHEFAGSDWEALELTRKEVTSKEVKHRAAR